MRAQGVLDLDYFVVVRLCLSISPHRYTSGIAVLSGPTADHGSS